MGVGMRLSRILGSMAARGPHKTEKPPSRGNEKTDRWSPVQRKNLGRGLGNMKVVYRRTTEQL